MFVPKRIKKGTLVLLIIEILQFLGVFLLFMELSSNNGA
jgi:hypothetical protein